MSNRRAPDLVVLGAGAAGLFCAFHAARRGHDVLVLERANKVGKKILMSGGGRCNFTHLSTGPEHFISQNPHFCKSALARFTPWEFLNLVEQHEIGWHEKTPGQLFCNDSSKSIVAMLLKECAQAGVEIRTHCEVDGASADAHSFKLRTSSGVIEAGGLVVATGGLSVPSLGGSDFGYQLARQFGHSVVATRPGLVPMTLTHDDKARWCDLSGISFPVAVEAGGARFDDELLITHRGLSGPAVLQISSFWQPGDPIRFDLMPETDAAQFLDRQLEESPAREIQNVLSQRFPKRLAQRMAESRQLRGKLMDINRAEISALAAVLHDWGLQPVGTEGYRTAEVTLGGIDTEQVSSRTFESKLQPGLFFIGEVLDVTGWLGGYNFQWAWASAHACAQSL